MNNTCGDASIIYIICLHDTILTFRNVNMCIKVYMSMVPVIAILLYGVHL